MNNFERLKLKISEIATTSDWDKAKNEFTFIRAIRRENSNCLCGKAIVNVCKLEHKITKQIIEVGNCCCRKFLGVDEGTTILNSLKKLEGDINNSISAACIDYLHKRKVYNDFEQKFYKNIQRKRELSDKQNEIKNRLNQKLLYFCDASREDSQKGGLMKRIDTVINFYYRKNIFVNDEFLNSLKSYLEKYSLLTDKQLKVLQEYEIRIAA